MINKPIGYEFEKEFPLMRTANRIFSMLPVHMQFAIDEDMEEFLEPEEIPDGYER